MNQEAVKPAIAIGVFVVVFLVFFVVELVIKIFYILTLQKAFGRCAPQNQAMAPGLAWLMLIPVFSLVWHFFVVLNLAKSLGQEFRARGMTEDPDPGKTIGLAMCICASCAVIPYIGILPGLAAFILWIIYWVKMAEYSRKLATV